MCDNHVHNLADRIQRARKLYACEECSGPILPGMEYRYQRFVDDEGARYEYRTHPPCWDFVLATEGVFDEDGICWMLSSVRSAEGLITSERAEQLDDDQRALLTAIVSGRRYLRHEGAKLLFAGPSSGEGGAP